MTVWAVVSAANYVLVLITLGFVLLQRRREPAAMLAWILALLLLPGLGLVLYWLLDSARLRRKSSRRRRRVAHLLARFQDWAERQGLGGAEAAPADLPPDLTPIAQIGQRLAGVPVTAGNEVTILEEANETYAALEAAIRSARHHVHLEYYIWRADETGRHFADLLIERARAGVECRLLLDAVGSWTLRPAFLRPLRQAGVRVAFFLPLWPLTAGRRLSVHLRNHRKIAVVDGQVAFTGSQNIGDEYRGRRKALSPWFDTHLRVHGPAAAFLQETFAEDWFLATRESLDREAYFPVPDRRGTSLVQIVPSGPDHSVSVLAQVVFAAFAAARQSIRMATPYFVPDPTVRMALASACFRGVKVRIVVPSRSDSRLVLWAGRSYYPELLEHGVEIYEYDGGVLHSKLVTVDERWAMLGSANMDVRSFRLNFEITALLYDAATARHLNATIDRFCAGARPVRARDVWRNRSLPRRLGEGAARLLTPLL